MDVMGGDTVVQTKDRQGSQKLNAGKRYLYFADTNYICFR
jgi:hypothetical protein